MSSFFENPKLKRLQARCFQVTSAISVLLTVLRYQYLMPGYGWLIGLVTGLSTALIGADINRIKMFPETLSQKPPPSWFKAFFVISMIVTFSANSFVYTFVSYQLAFTALGLIAQGPLFLSLGVSFASLSALSSFLNLSLAYGRDWNLNTKGLFFEKLTTALNLISQFDNHLLSFISYALTFPGLLGVMAALLSRVSSLTTSFVLDYTTNILDKKESSTPKHKTLNIPDWKKKLFLSLGAFTIIEVSLSALVLYVQGFMLLTTATLNLPVALLLVPALFLGGFSALSTFLFHARHLEKLSLQVFPNEKNYSSTSTLFSQLNNSTALSANASLSTQPVSPASLRAPTKKTNLWFDFFCSAKSGSCPASGKLKEEKREHLYSSTPLTRQL